MKIVCNFINYITIVTSIEQRRYLHSYRASFVFVFSTTFSLLKVIIFPSMQHMFCRNAISVMYILRCFISLYLLYLDPSIHRYFLSYKALLSLEIGLLYFLVLYTSDIESLYFIYLLVCSSGKVFFLRLTLCVLQFLLCP